MGFKTVQSLDAENAIALGGRNKKTGKANPTSVEGYYIGTRKVDSKKSKTGQCDLHFLQTQDGNLGVWGKTDLDRKLRTVSPGTMVRLTCVGQVPTPNGDMYKFKVEQDDSNTIEVADLNQESYDSADSDAPAEEQSYASEPLDEEPQVFTKSSPVPAQSSAARVQALLNGSKAAKTGAR